LALLGRCVGPSRRSRDQNERPRGAGITLRHRAGIQDTVAPINACDNVISIPSHGCFLKRLPDKMPLCRRRELHEQTALVMHDAAPVDWHIVCVAASFLRDIRCAKIDFPGRHRQRISMDQPLLIAGRCCSIPAMRPNSKTAALRSSIRRWMSFNPPSFMALGWSGDVEQARIRANDAQTGAKLAYFVPREGALMTDERNSALSVDTRSRCVAAAVISINPAAGRGAAPVASDRARNSARSGCTIGIGLAPMGCREDLITCG